MFNVAQPCVRRLSALLFVWTLAISARASAFSGGITTASFGSGGCNECHSGGIMPTVELIGPTAVLPDSTNEYTLRISATDSQNRGGLNVSAAAGTLSTGGSAAMNTQAVPVAGGRTEITHLGAKAASGGFVTFSFLWTAPSAFSSVTLEAWGNAVNGNGNNGGDRAAMATLDISAATTSPCDAAPRTDCRKPTAAGASTFQLKDNVNDTKDALTWKWSKGEQTLLTDFGDPLAGSTSYTLCIYDESAGVPSAVMHAIAPPGGTCAGKPCWKATKSGFTYKDKDTGNDGILQIVLKQGVAGKASIVVKGKGTSLQMPAPAGPGLFAQDTKVIVQLKNSDGVCWDAEYSSPAKKNDTAQFNDKSD